MAFQMRARAWRTFAGGLLLGWGAVAAQPAPQAAAAPASAPATASRPALPALESFFGHPDLAAPLLSPSGRWLAVLARGTDAKQRNRLVVLDLQRVEKPKSLAAFTDADIDDVHWVGDEHLVFDVVDLNAGSGQQQMAPGLFSVAREDGALRELVKLRNEYFVRVPSTGDRRLDYNHGLLHVPSTGHGSGTEVIVGEFLWGSNGRVESITPKRLDVRNGRVRSMAQGTPDAVTRWLFDADGEPRAVVARVPGQSGQRRVHWRAPGQDAWTLLLEADTLNMPWWPHSVDASGHLYVTSAQGPGGLLELRRFDFAAGRPAREPMLTVAGFDFRGHLVSEAAGGTTLGVRVESDAETTAWLDPRLKLVQEEVDRRLPGRVNSISCRRCASDERVLLVESWSDREPGEFLVWHGAAQGLTLLGRAQRAIDPAQMATLDLRRIKARDGRDLPVWVTLPAPAAGADAAPRPAIVLVHGGPWVRGNFWRWHAMPQFLASRGYVVIEPEFRGSTGYGDAHFRAGWRQWGQAMQDDVADAVKWAAAQRLIDPARVCIAGASYGGYATLMGLVRDPDLYRCGAAWAAVTEPMRLLERSWWWGDDISEEARRHSLPVLLGDPKTDAEMLQAISPLQQAARIRAPPLLAFGGKDLRVPLVHGHTLRDALKREGREPEWIVYPEEGHGWQRLENQHDFARRLEAFFARHLKP